MALNFFSYNRDFFCEREYWGVFLAALEFELKASHLLGRHSYSYCLSHPTSPFLWWVFLRDRVSRTVCLGWLWTVILLISASWVARIIGVSHQCPAHYWFLLGKCCTTWAIMPFLFALVIFEIESHFFPLWVAGPQSSYLYFPKYLGWQACTTTHSFFCWDRVLWTFCLVWPGPAILLISDFHVAGMKGMCHCTQLLFKMRVLWVFCLG
jgi:hypothetical protein